MCFRWSYVERHTRNKWGLHLIERGSDALWPCKILCLKVLNLSTEVLLTILTGFVHSSSIIVGNNVGDACCCASSCEMQDIRAQHLEVFLRIYFEAYLINYNEGLIEIFSVCEGHGLKVDPSGNLSFFRFHLLTWIEVIKGAKLLCVYVWDVKQILQKICRRSWYVPHGIE